MSTISAKKILLLGFIAVMLVAIPLSVYVAQKQQQTKTQASVSTSLSFNPPKKDVTKVGEIISFDIMLDPDPGAGNPPNQVSFAKLIINYDPLKLAIVDLGLVPTTAFPTVLEEPAYSSGSVSVTLSIGSDPTKAIQTKTKIAAISFKTLTVTDGTKIVFATGTQVLSVASGDQAGENVLLANPVPAIVTVIEVSPTIGPTTSPVSSKITCTGLGLDRSPNGNAPYSIALTGSGNASIGTITKASFNFGDGPIEDVLQGGGIGTNSVSVQKAHTYQNPGSYTASVVFTADNGTLSSLSNCTQAITVNSPGVGIGGAGGPPSPTGTEVAQIAPTVIPTVITEQLSPSPILTPIPPTGPSPKLIGIGIAGAILSIIGGIIFFVL